MVADDKTSPGFSLRRWSRRKLEATREVAAADTTAPSPTVPGPATPPAATSAAAASGTPPEAPRLPPVESLTSESDFAAFMHPKVDEGLRRQALKKLFADPRFNVMDGLDVYIDDYSIPDPIAPDVLERLTRMGFVRDAGAAPVEPPPSEAGSPAAERAPVAPEVASSTPPADPIAPPAPSTSADPPATTAGPGADVESSRPRTR